MEPTKVNANRFARVPGGSIALRPDILRVLRGSGRGGPEVNTNCTAGLTGRTKSVGDRIPMGERRSAERGLEADRRSHAEGTPQPQHLVER